MLYRPWVTVELNGGNGTCQWCTTKPKYIEDPKVNSNDSK